MKKFTLAVDENGILNLPEELLKETGWKEGDVLEWIPTIYDDGSYYLRKQENE
jgi:bifunctional DNA-binding transcriptional regulator/antitoxin component of YhaV-PrlF toxin-antitoxin module